MRLLDWREEGALQLVGIDIAVSEVAGLVRLLNHKLPIFTVLCNSLAVESYPKRQFRLTPFDGEAIVIISISASILTSYNSAHMPPTEAEVIFSEALHIEEVALAFPQCVSLSPYNYVA